MQNFCDEFVQNNQGVTLPLDFELQVGTSSGEEFQSPQKITQKRGFQKYPLNDNATPVSPINRLPDTLDDLCLSGTMSPLRFSSPEPEIIDLTNPRENLERRKEFMWCCIECRHYNSLTKDVCEKCQHHKDARSALYEIYNLVDCSHVCLTDDGVDDNAINLGEESNLRKKNWFLTCNFEKDLPPSLTRQVVEDFSKWINAIKGINCCIYGFEQGEDEERLHVHAFINYDKNRARTSLLKPYVLNRLWDANVKYLKTAEDIVKVIRYVAKKRTKIYGRKLNEDLFIRDDAKGYILSKLNSVSKETKKMKDEDIFNMYESEIRKRQWESIPQYFVFKNAKKINDYAEIFNKPDIPAMQPHCAFIFNYGKPGTGKSSIAKDFALQLYGRFYEKPLNKWWNGYQGEEVVILDDITPDQFARFQAELKVWTDRYAFDAEVKGSVIHINPEWVIITSNYSLQELTSGNQYQYYLQAMVRRAGFGNRINTMDEPGYYLPKVAWEQAPEQEQVLYAERLQNYIAKNSVAYADPDNPIISS